MKNLSLSDCNFILRRIAKSDRIELGSTYRDTGLYEFIKSYNPELTEVKCEQIIQCVVANYRPNANPMTGNGMRPESWEDWLRRMMGAPPQTYEEYIKDVKKEGY